MTAEARAAPPGPERGSRQSNTHQVLERVKDFPANGPIQHLRQRDLTAELLGPPTVALLELQHAHSKTGLLKAQRRFAMKHDGADCATLIFLLSAF